MFIEDNNTNIFNFEDGYKQIFKNVFTLNIGINEILNMKHNDTLTERDLSIAKFLYNLCFATSHQVYSFLEEDEKKVNIKNRLDKLVKYRILNKFYLVSPDSVDDDIPANALEIYCLDIGGRYLLENFSNIDASDWTAQKVNYQSSKCVAKILSTTSFYLQLLKSCKGKEGKLVYFRANPPLRVGKQNVIPSFDFCLRINGSLKYFLGESVRDYDIPLEFKEKVEKLESLLTTKAWMKYYNDEDVVNPAPPLLFILAESDEIMLKSAEIMNNVSEIKKYRLTTDQRMQVGFAEKGAFYKFIPEKKSFETKKTSIFS